MLMDVGSDLFFKKNGAIVSIYVVKPHVQGSYLYPDLPT